MSAKWFEHIAINFKETLDVILFALMADTQVFAWFGASSLYFVLIPSMGFLLLIMTALNGYNLYQSRERNFEQWLAFIALAVVSLASNASFLGTIISKIAGVTFAAGPWVFLAAVLAGSAYQTVMLGINIYGIYTSASNTPERRHYIQAVIKNVLMTVLLLSAIGALVFVMITPVAPVVGAVCAILASTLTAISLLWRITPEKWKEFVKRPLGLAKTETIVSNNPSYTIQASPELGISQNQHRYTPLFAAIDYSNQIKSMHSEAATQYLKGIIIRKTQELSSKQVADSEKARQKSVVLLSLKKSMDTIEPISKQEMIREYPLAFQMLRTGKSEIEQLVDAVVVLQVQRSKSCLPSLSCSLP